MEGKTTTQIVNIKQQLARKPSYQNRTNKTLICFRTIIKIFLPAAEPSAESPKRKTPNSKRAAAPLCRHKILHGNRLLSTACDVTHVQKTFKLFCQSHKSRCQPSVMCVGA